MTESTSETDASDDPAPSRSRRLSAGAVAGIVMAAAVTAAVIIVVAILAAAGALAR